MHGSDRFGRMPLQRRYRWAGKEAQYGDEPDCTVDGCFWDIETSGMTGSAGGTGLPSARLQTESTFTQAGWNFSPKSDSGDYWVLLPEPQYPTFAWQILNADPNVRDSDAALSFP